MLFRTLLGMRWGDLSDDVRQMLLERADLDTFNGADGERYSQGTLHFRNTPDGGFRLPSEWTVFPEKWKTTGFSLTMTPYFFAYKLVK